MKNVWTLNIFYEEADYFDYEIFRTREKAVEAMNERKEAMVKDLCLNVYHEDERQVVLIPEECDQYLLNYTCKMWINEKVVY